VRVVWGADDAWIDPDVGRGIAERIPSATFALVDGAGHLV
jgi:pimeloyl-ACP methyl ester carboxylesterase